VSLNNQPPTVINLQRFLDAEDSDLEIADSQLTETADDSSTTTVEQPVDQPVDEPVDKPVFRHNDMDWFLVKDLEDVDINGSVPEVTWRFMGIDGLYMEPGDDREGERNILDYFLSSMPKSTIRRMLKETNEKLIQAGDDVCSYAELLRFFGVCILITHHEFPERRDLWSTKTGSKYIAAPNLAATGMSRHRFDAIWRCLTFSIQPPNRPAGTSSADYRWMLVDDFVDDYNEHRLAKFRPSELVRITALVKSVDLTISNRIV
jgi:hypothetical protein